VKYSEYKQTVVDAIIGSAFTKELSAEEAIKITIITLNAMDELRRLVLSGAVSLIEEKSFN